MKNVFGPTHKVSDSRATRMFQAAFKDRWPDVPVTTTSKSATVDLSSLDQADKIRVEAWVNRYMDNYDISVKIKGGTNAKVKDADLSEKERDDLPKSDFGIPSERKFPMPDAEHVRSAASYFHTAEDKFKPELAKKILSKAKEFGVDISSDEIEKWAKKKADTKRKVRAAKVKDGIDYNTLDNFSDPDRAQAFIKTFMLNAVDAEELKESAQYTYTSPSEGSWQVLRPKELPKYGYSQDDVDEFGIEGKDFVLMPV